MFKHLCIGLCVLYLIQECMSDICATCLCSNTSKGPTINCHDKRLASNDMLNSDLLLLDEHEMLNKLIFSNNEIVELPSHILKKLKQLKSLDLSENLIKEVHMNTFADLSTLEELNLSRNRLEVFNTVLLQAVPSLCSLNLSHNNIKSIDFTINMTGGKLSTLDLSYNNISDLSSDLFKSLGSVRVLDLSFNLIKSIEEDSLLQLHSLQTLHMHNNVLSSLDLKIFPKSLEVLDCGFNNIANVYYDTCNIKKLSMEQNDLAEIPADLRKLKQLQELNVRGNTITSFPNVTLKNLTNLDVSDNKLPNMPNAFSTANFPQLESLNVSRNPMRALTFSNKIILTKFSATNMVLLEVIEENALKNLGVPANACLNLTISDNKNLYSLHENCLDHLHICSLDLSNNNLTSLSSKLIPLKRNFNTYRLNLQGNPFNCNCTLQWMLNDLIPQLYVHQPQLLENLRCKSPSPISNMRMIHWYDWKGEIFCSDMSHLKENFILAKPEPSETEVITFESSSGMFIVIAVTIGVLTILVAIGLLLSRRLSAKRRRLNRRF